MRGHSMYCTCALPPLPLTQHLTADHPQYTGRHPTGLDLIWPVEEYRLPPGHEWVQKTETEWRYGRREGEQS